MTWIIEICQCLSVTCLPIFLYEKILPGKHIIAFDILML